jgi:hypothetical protein
MANKFELPTDNGLAKKVIDSESKHTQLKIKAGWLGTFFGVGKNVGLYIVGLISLILLLTATAYTFIPDDYKSKSFSAEKLWNIVLPVITTLIGYIFGFNNSSKTSNEDE